MNDRRMTAATARCVFWLTLLAIAGWTASAQGPDASQPGIRSLEIRGQAIPERPFSVVGPRGAILGRQDGTYELWLFPWKILSGMRLSVQMQDYPVPIEVNPLAADIDVRPDETTITYSHANFTIRQIMLAPKNLSAGTGAMVIYEMQAIRPMTVTFSFEPVMQRMWPADSPAAPSPEWVKNSDGSGFYILHLALPGDSAAMTIPGSEPGILPPYQERAATWPLQFVVHFDPKQDGARSYPLLMSFADTSAAGTGEAQRHRLDELQSQVGAICDANRAYYANLEERRTALDTPDRKLNEAFSWAETAIDQLRVQTTSGGKEEALTAGFIGSGEVDRPGFGWYFGRDALWSLYAVNSYGDFETTKQEIDFLLQHQRDDGKIMHERSQTADLVPWESLPYEYAAADSTPLLPMAVDDYLKISGDREFVAANWQGLERAWNFEVAHDSDGDGIYDNSQGTGWVESWVPKMPHQEIYLAALDEQASLAFADLAGTTGHGDLANQARQRAARIARTIEAEYYLADAGYAFSWNGTEGVDKTESIFPSVAWWDGTYRLEHPEPMMEQWSGSNISTDWGTRIISDRTSFYDPISYHQGTVWPLYTGWVSVAEYRAGQDIDGYAHMMQNANLTWAQDPGDVTELLSGRFYQVLGRSTAHQLWSSAMVISPVLRGLFGLEWSAARNTLTVTPHLPAQWDQAAIQRLPFGNRTVDLSFRRDGRELVVQSSDPELHLDSRLPGAAEQKGMLRIPLSAVEAGIEEHLPAFGAETHQMKVLDQSYTEHALVLKLSAPGGSSQILSIRENGPVKSLATSDGDLGIAQNLIRPLTIHFPHGAGYVDKTVTLRW